MAGLFSGFRFLLQSVPETRAHRLRCDQKRSVFWGLRVHPPALWGSADFDRGDHGALRESPPGHQFQSPATRRSAGPITMRTRVASMNTATASVNPSILTTRKLPKVKAANTTIMIAAALVISPAVLASPSGIASNSLIPLRLASRTRATRNTS